MDVAIAGGGIGGVVLALALARRGLSVVVVEQSRRFAPLYRGEFLQPRTLEILDELGVGEGVRAVTTPVYQTRLRSSDGRTFCLVDYTRLRTGRVREGRNGHHRAIQAAVLKALAQLPNAEVRMATRVTGLLRDYDGTVVGLQTSGGPVPARLVVGADGQYSVVREKLAIPVRSYRYPGEPLAVTVELGRESGESVDFVFGVGESGLMFPLPEGKARLYLVVSDAEYAAMQKAPDRGLALFKQRLTAVMPWLAEAIAAIPDMDGVQRVPCFYLRARRWVADGAALIGDAVHCVSPTRGQGMNLAIQDAWALAELVAALPRDRTLTARELRPYERTRRRPAAFIQGDAGRVHRMLLWSRPGAVALRDFYLGLVMRAPETGAAILGMYAGTARPPRWYDHLFVTAAMLFPALDRPVARLWGSRLGPVPSPVRKGRGAPLR